MAEKTGVFICYRRQSPSTYCASALRREIQRRYPGADVFHDGVSLQAGAEWPERIRDALDGSAVLLALIDENWATVSKGPRPRLDYRSDWVRQELLHAEEIGAHVIPVLIGKAKLPTEREDLTESLQWIYERQSRRLRDDPRDQENDLREIVEAVGKHLPAAAEDAPAPDSPPLHAAAIPADLVPLEEALALIVEIAPGPRELFNLASSRDEVGAHRFAELLYRAAAEQFAEEAGPEDEWTLVSGYGLASALLSQGKVAEAETRLHELSSRCTKLLGQEDELTLLTQHEHARALLNLGKAAKAESTFRKFISLWEKVYGPLHPHTIAVRRALAQACLEQQAANRAREALALLPEDGADPSPLLEGKTLMLRAWLADLDGEVDRAARLLDKADAHLAHLAPEHYARRELAKYRETRVPGGPGGTMIWSPDAAR